MATETDSIENEDFKNLLNVIIQENDIDPKAKITTGASSTVGEGYMSRTLVVDIESDKNTLNLFLKCALSVKSSEIAMDRLYANEVLFYDHVYPSYMNFLKKHCIEDRLLEVPKCYGVTENIIALENLRMKDFEIYTPGKLMNDDHINAAFKSFARFHAVSFVFKEEEKEKYEEFAKKTYAFEDGEEENSFTKSIKILMKKYMEKLDIIGDKYTLDKLQSVYDHLHDIIMQPIIFDEAGILTKGDTWNNNTMFRYEGENKETPVDVMLVDWQLIRNCSPVFDLSFFFYPIAATEEILGKLEHYLKIYHEELSQTIRKLGKDPDVLYPYSLLWKQWKEHSLFGYSLCFLFCKMNLITSDEVQTFEDVGEVDITKVHHVNQEIRNEKIYTNRLKALAKHMLDSEFL